MECICIDCKHQCSEYWNNGISDKSYYEWTLKQEECKEKEENNKI